MRPSGPGVSRDIVVRQTGELRGGADLHRPDVVADVAVELLADHDQLLAEGLDPRAGGRVSVHAGQAEVAQNAADVVPGHRVGTAEIDGPHRVEYPLVERDLRREGGDLAVAAVGRLPHRGVRMDLLNQPGGARRPVELAHQPIVGHEGVGHRALALHPHQPCEEVTGVVEPRVHRALERRRVGMAAPERLVLGVGWSGGGRERGGDGDVAKAHQGSGKRLVNVARTGTHATHDAVGLAVGALLAVRDAEDAVGVPAVVPHLHRGPVLP